MIVDEVIKALQAYPGDTLVLVDGYESGYDDIDEISETTVYAENNPWYEGHYQTYQEDKRNLRAVCICR